MTLEMFAASEVELGKDRYRIISYIFIKNSLLCCVRNLSMFTSRVYNQVDFVG